jgi:D-arabinose 1-dehydrogenase-like Zn-dependent alcohol dehydrogenase
MKAVVVHEPGKVTLADIPEPSSSSGETLLQIRMIGLCGTDLNTFRGKNPLVTFPRVLGHEVAATILRAGSGLANDLRWQRAGERSALAAGWRTICAKVQQ